MTSQKTKTKGKVTIKNFTLNEFEQMAQDAANENGINDLDKLTVSFSKIIHGETTDNNFFVNYESKSGSFYGLSALPELAISEAIERRNRALGIVRINAQTIKPQQ